MARNLVTGGAGFVASHAGDALAARGDPVRVVDELSTGCRDNLAEQPDAELITADVADPQAAEAAVTGVDYVLQMASMFSVLRSVQEPRCADRANVNPKLELLPAARGARVHRMVLASSAPVARLSAHATSSRRRRSNNSNRACTASVWLPTMCASGASATFYEWSVSSPAQSRNTDRNPYGTASTSRSLSILGNREMLIAFRFQLGKRWADPECAMGSSRNLLRPPRANGL